MGYGDLWQGEAKFYQIQQFLVVGTILVMFKWLTYGVFLFFIDVLAFNYYMVQRRVKKKDKHEGKRYVDSRTMREKEYREDKIYEIDQVVEIPLNQPIPEDLLKEDPDYQNALAFVIRKREKQRLFSEETQPITPGVISANNKDQIRTTLAEAKKKLLEGDQKKGKESKETLKAQKLKDKDVKTATPELLPAKSSSANNTDKNIAENGKETEPKNEQQVTK